MFAQWLVWPLKQCRFIFLFYYTCFQRKILGGKEKIRGFSPMGQEAEEWERKGWEIRRLCVKMGKNSVGGEE